MATDSIRLSLTNEVRDVMTRLKDRYSPLSEPEIIKLGLAELDNASRPISKLMQTARKGKSNFSKWMKENKGKNIDVMSEEEIYEIIENN